MMLALIPTLLLTFTLNNAVYTLRGTGILPEHTKGEDINTITIIAIFYDKHLRNQ